MNALAWMTLFLILGQQADPPEEGQTAPPPPTQAADQPGAEAADAEPHTPGLPSAEDVIRQFQQQRPTATPLLPTGPEGETIERGRGDELGDSTDPRMAKTRLPEGYMLVDRVGRLSAQGEWWVLTFESDSDSYPEPPMKLLPNRLLERMVRESQGGSEPIVFILTGEITDFRGENYLLVRKVLRKREMGNLHK